MGVEDLYFAMNVEGWGFLEEAMGELQNNLQMLALTRLDLCDEVLFHCTVKFNINVQFSKLKLNNNYIFYMVIQIFSYWISE